MLVKCFLFSLGSPFSGLYLRLLYRSRRASRMPHVPLYSAMEQAGRPPILLRRLGGSSTAVLRSRSGGFHRRRLGRPWYGTRRTIRRPLAIRGRIGREFHGTRDRFCTQFRCASSLILEGFKSRC